jgi:hypothetical protein
MSEFSLVIRRYVATPFYSNRSNELKDFSPASILKSHVTQQQTSLFFTYDIAVVVV